MTNFVASFTSFFTKRLPRQAAVAVLRLYQRTLSPDHGWFRPLYPYGACKFHPTCSEYTIQSIERHGLIRGSAAGLRRVLRCHPWALGGHDPVT